MSAKKGGAADDGKWLGDVLGTVPPAITRRALDRAFALDTAPCTKQRHKENCRENPYCLKGFAAAGSEAAKKKRQQQLAAAVVEEDSAAAAIAAVAAAEAVDVDAGKTEDAPGDMIKADLSVPCGLVNEGATCYANALIQSLFALRSFRRGVFEWREGDGSAPAAAENAICRELQRLFVQLALTEQRYIDPIQLVEALRLDTGEQQDAQEFQKLFLAHIEERFRRCPAVASLVQDHFQGECSYVTKCKACGREARSRTFFSEMELNIEKRDTVEECLHAFVAEEELSGSNQYLCSACEKKQDAGRRVVLERLPSVLNLQLIRFQFDLKTLGKKKLRTVVSFPFELDMEPYLSPSSEIPPPGPHVYELFAVLIHRGASANGGHYICHARPEGSDVWYEYDDTTVSEIPAKQVGSVSGEKKSSSKKLDASRASSQGAYVLLYRKRGKPVVDAVPTPSLVEEVSSGNAALREMVDKWNEAQKQTEKLRKERAELVKLIIEQTEEAAASPNRGRTSWFWLSTNWWERFVSEDEPGPLDNSRIVCEHGGHVSPFSRPHMKCVPQICWEMLCEKFPGGPKLEITDYCVHCFVAYCKSLKTKLSTGQTRQEFIAKIKEEKDVAPKEGMWISVEWLREWMKDPDVTTDMTELITCRHGNLTTGKKAKRLISVYSWSYLSGLYSAKREFHGKTKPCATCEEKEQEHESEVADQKPIKQQAKKALAVLLPNAIGGTRRVGSFFALSASWYNAWVQWVTEADNVIPPPPLDNKDVLCPHGLFRFDPNADYPAAERPFVLVPEDAWGKLRKRYGTSDLVEVQIEKTSDIRDATTIPEICWGCITESSDRAHEARRKFTNGALIVKRLSGTFDSVRAAVVEAGTAPSSSAVASAQEDVARRSTRLRTKTGTKVEGISCEWTVHALKNHLHFNFERELRCPVALQQVLIYERVVMEDEKPLTHYNVEEGSTVTLAVLDTSADASNFDEPIAPRRPETGFAGTMLVDSPSRPVPSSSASSASSNSATPRPIPPVFDDVVSAPAAPSEQPPAKRQKAEDPGIIQ